jgi:integrase/recombinase XerD
MTHIDVFRTIRRRAAEAVLLYSTCCHTFRATRITAYPQKGSALEHAQQIAAHESPRTTRLYDRTQHVISLDEVERIRDLTVAFMMQTGPIIRAQSISE